MQPFIPLHQQQSPFRPLPQQSSDSDSAQQKQIDTQGVSNEIASQLKPSIEAIKNGQATPEDIFMKWFNGMNRQQRNCLKKAMNTGIVKNIFKSFGVSEANYNLASKLINNSN